jgi:uncharacterized protein (DUF1800 family)
MTRIVLLALLTPVALVSEAHALSPDDARHLLERTGFGANPAQVSALVDLDRAQAVDQLLGGLRTQASQPPPRWATAPADEAPDKTASGPQRKRRRMQRRQRVDGLRGWWAEEMRTTASPFTERVVLFWHGLLTTDARKVKRPRLLYRHNALLRQLGAGDVRRLYRAVARDPAMLIYLDGVRSRPRAPNENFARELFELFSLGEGRGYTEADVQQAARAFAGWKVDRRTGEARQRRADRGEKSVLGQRGRFDGDGVIEVLFRQPRVAEHLAERVWVEFVGPTPDPAGVARVAHALRRGGFVFKAALRAALLEPAFWAPAGRGALVKSPIVLVVGAARTLGWPVEGDLLARQAAQLGHRLLSPPSVKGWPRGVGWLGSDAVIGRDRFARQIAAEARLLRWLRSLPSRDRTAVRARLLARPPAAPLPPSAPGIPEGEADTAYVAALLVDPVFQTY